MRMEFGKCIVMGPGGRQLQNPSSVNNGLCYLMGYLKGEITPLFRSSGYTLNALIIGGSIIRPRRLYGHANH